MRASPGKRTPLALALLASSTVAACTLVNSLDYLQSGLGASSLDDAEGGASRDALAPGPDGAGPLPGCAPEAWSGCGVTVVMDTLKPGGLGWALVDDLYFSDEASGRILHTKCTASGCSTPVARVSGEVAPRAVAFTSDSLLWTTPKALRRLRPIRDADAGVVTLDTLSSDADLVTEYPYAAWADARGARVCNVNSCQVKTLGATPARSPAINAGYWFVADGVVKVSEWDGFGTPSPAATRPSTEGAERVVRATMFASPFEGRAGMVATVRRDATTAVIVADYPDDAGVATVLSTQREAVRSIVATAGYVYWTTDSGELRRQGKDTSRYTTVLNGLGSDTVLAASLEGLVAIADRTRGSLLLYAAP